MNPQLWQRIEEVYYSALPLAQTQRVAYVARACHDDPVLQQQVASLLDADDSLGKFLETTIFEMGLTILASGAPKDLATVTHPVIQGLSGATLDGRYRIDRELGHGGVGVVYLAHDQKLHNKRVVVKVLLEKSLNNKWISQKFQQEKEALARVDHPGIVGILDDGKLPNGEPYLVMQFVEGVSLREAIQAEPEGIALERVASIIKQAGLALRAVHERKIFHRDLKPENIMLQRLNRGEEQVKILDFGVAKVKESLIAPSTATGVMSAGTIVYMSPEQLHGDKVAAPSDIYSLGVTAYEMITGRRPFKPDTIAQLSDMQRNGVRVNPIDLRPRLPQTAQAVILRALAFDPALRYQNAAEFGDELARALLQQDEELHDLEDRAAPHPQLTVAASPQTPLHVASSPGAETIRTWPTWPETFNRSTGLDKPPRVAFSLNSPWLKLTIGFLTIVIVASALFILKPFAVNPSAPPSLPPPVERSLAYSLTVQKMRDGRAYQDPFQSSGQEIFENGYKFRLNFSSPDSGYLYVFNEGANETGALSFSIIYPTPSTNQGSAKVEGNQPIQTNWNTFAGQAGTEDFWIVWSASSIAQMDAARNAAFRNQGTLGDAAMVRTIREFLTKNADPKLETMKDTMKRQTLVRGRVDVLVKLVELEHR
jgi:serine/threonine protein kinase